jgi:hypothetical protein
VEGKTRWVGGGWQVACASWGQARARLGWLPCRWCRAGKPCSVAPAHLHRGVQADGSCEAAHHGRALAVDLVYDADDARSACLLRLDYLRGQAVWCVCVCVGGGEAGG